MSTVEWDEVVLMVDDVAAAELDTEGDAFHSAYVVYSAERDGEDVSFVVVDGREGPSYDYVQPGTLRFVDRHKVAFTAQRGDTVWRVTHELTSDAVAQSRP